MYSGYEAWSGNGGIDCFLQESKGLNLCCWYMVGVGVSWW